ncbi:hypothetical protein [Pelagibacterium limicola]|uniref:hypothetical protein n=1 Tax=Pelagibacterium limicola TaxID=2791022 RepID=UPI0018B00EB9|nr:hypothetical protein [Pelagibacterium limicola]
MTEYETIVYVRSEARARVLIAALRAHGFSPRDIADGGLPGVSAGFSGTGVPIAVPEEEAADAKPLAEALLADMEA